MYKKECCLERIPPFWISPEPVAHLCCNFATNWWGWRAYCSCEQTHSPVVSEMALSESLHWQRIEIKFCLKLGYMPGEKLRDYGDFVGVRFNEQNPHKIFNSNSGKAKHLKMLKDCHQKYQKIWHIPETLLRVCTIYHLEYFNCPFFIGFWWKHSNHHNLLALPNSPDLILVDFWIFSKLNLMLEMEISKHFRRMQQGDNIAP